MATQEPLSGLLYLEEGQDGSPVAVNEAFAILAILARRKVVDKRSTPPGSPTNGQCHLVGSSPTAAWTSLTQNTLVCWSSAFNSWVVGPTLSEGDDVSVNTSGGGIGTSKTKYILGSGGASDFQVVKTWT